MEFLAGLAIANLKEYNLSSLLLGGLYHKLNKRNSSYIKLMVVPAPDTTRRKTTDNWR